MIVNKAFKTEIKPNAEQLQALRRHCGAARFVYNWGLRRKIRFYRLFSKTVSAKTLDTHLRKLKSCNEDYAWLNEISSHTRQEALANLDKAYKAFFTRVKGGKKGSAVGFPRFKSRHKGIGSATFFSYRVEPGHINLSNVGRVKLAENGYMPTGSYNDNGKEGNKGVHFYGLRVSERAGRWYASLQVEISIADTDATGKPVVGVDVGIKSLAVVSDGTRFDNPKALRRYMRKLKRAQRAVTRKTKGSANRHKAVARLAKIHARIANIRGDATHKTTAVIARNSSVIGIETLNVQGMARNHKIAGAVLDANMGEFHRQLKYKAEWNGASIVQADKWMPSSKTCSACGCVKEELALSERIFRCDDCGAVIDRDINAAINLAKLAETSEKSDNK